MVTMPVRIATYRKLFIALGMVLVGAQFVASFAFRGGPLSQSTSGLLFAPFLAPAIGGAFVIHAWARPLPKEIGLTLGLGGALAVLHVAAGRLLHEQSPIALHVVFGIGLASLVIAATNAARTKGATRSEWLSILLPGAVLPAFVLASDFFLGLTALLHPRVLDSSVLVADTFFGRQPSFLVGRLFEDVPALAVASRFVYWNLPLALAFVYGARRRRDPERSDAVLFSFIAVGLFGFALYHLYPVVGPTFFVRGFPADPAQWPDAARAYLVPIPVFRNCMPSLHTAWALLLFWHSRPLARTLRWWAAAWLAFTELGTLGFGYHYAMDLVVAVPFTMAVRGIFAATWGGSALLRRVVVALGALVTLAWFVALRFFPAGDDAWRWSFAALTVFSSFLFELGFDRAPAPTDRTSSDRGDKAMAALVLATGWAAAVGEIALAERLTLVFGNPAAVRAIMLACGMAGIAVGGIIAGEIVERRRDTLGLFALCLVGAAVVWAPAHGMVPWFHSLAIATSVVLLPWAILTGIALSLSVRLIARPDVGRAAAWVSGSAMLGAALGAWLTGYAILPFLGVSGTTWVPVLVDLCAGLAALRLAARPRPLFERAEFVAAPDPRARATGRAATALLALGGAAAIAVAAVHVRFLTVVAANSFYAGPMLVSALAFGAAAGAVFARRRIATTRPSLRDLTLVGIALTAAVAIGAPAWSAIPDYFASFAGYPLTATFGSRELVRLAVGSAMLLPPSFFAGAMFPIAIDLVARGSSAPMRAAGRSTALAMLGASSGLLLGFSIAPQLGTLVRVEPNALDAHVYFRPAKTAAREDSVLHSLLHTSARSDALVAGYGTGATARAVQRAGFRHVDVVESFDDVAFTETVDRLAEERGLELHRSDARPFLSLTSTRYDLLAVGSARLWLAGSTSLYGREFYRLAKERLRPEGVLEQGIPLHHLGFDDLVSLLGTIRSEFARVWLYVAGAQGVMVACNHDCAPTSATLASSGGSRRLVAERVLTPGAVDKFLGDVAAHGIAIETLVSTDDNLFLELDAPRGNVRDFESSLEKNVSLLRSFAPRSLLDGTRLSEQDLAPDPSEPESTPVDRPGLTQGARHGKTGR
jgi:hypothetical protein